MKQRELKELTIKQKAGVIYQIVTGCTWIDAYIVASGNKLEDILKSKNLNRLASSWKLSLKVQQYYNEQTAILKARQDQAIQQALKEYQENSGGNEPPKTETRTAAKNLDYSDPQTRKQLYNDIIKKSGDDPKTQLDAAKLFEQIQRDDKQAARDQQIQRFYTPEKCQECTIKAAFRRFRLQAEK